MYSFATCTMKNESHKLITISQSIFVVHPYCDVRDTFLNKCIPIFLEEMVHIHMRLGLINLFNLV